MAQTDQRPSQDFMKHVCIKVPVVFAFIYFSPTKRNAGHTLMNGSVSWHLVDRKWEQPQSRKMRSGGGANVCEWRVDELLMSFSPSTIWPMRHSCGWGPYDNMPPGKSLEQFCSSVFWIFYLLGCGRTVTSHLLSWSDAAPAFVSEVAAVPKTAGSTLLYRTGTKDADLSIVKMTWIQFSSQLVLVIKKWYIWMYESHCAQLQVPFSLWSFALLLWMWFFHFLLSSNKSLPWLLRR